MAKRVYAVPGGFVAADAGGWLDGVWSTREAAEAALGGITMVEWRMVPTKQTEAMDSAAVDASGGHVSPGDIDYLWPALLAAAPSPWQPIETARKDDIRILLSDGSKVNAAKWEDGYWVVATAAGPYDNYPVYFSDGREPEPTHWMPLPNPP
jgi:hypothetical protein